VPFHDSLQKKVCAFFNYYYKWLSAYIEFSEDKFPMAKGFGRCKPAIASPQHQLYQLVSGFIQGHLALQDGGDIQINVLTHGLACERVR
jgi:hypothetical protein